MRLVLTVAVLLAATPVLAEHLSRPVTDVTAIEDDGAARVLFKIGAPRDAERVAVRQATITVPVAGAVDARRIELQIHPVTTPWERGAVDWYAGWRRPGGDFDDGLFSVAGWDLAAGGPLVLDVTLLVKAILEDGFVADGFIVTVDPEVDRGLPVEDVPRLAALELATLEVEYRTVPRRPGREAARAQAQRQSGVAGESPRAR